ncbi:uncharacterized protein LOC110686456 [Chenopodium quinoa]|uniref:uncharacterized protein LOC110686456 n=1 Tax=Chenopodium quinoa TaxID=63459 RepID=UPI000B79235F|nr:uncharacterized protein LOC110686456 [Chenopodium quinoa]
MHPGGDNLYKDMKKTFWWPNMKKEVAEFVAKCLTCQKVKIEHCRPQGKQSLQKAMGTKLLMSTTFHPATDGQTERTIKTLEDMLRACEMDYQRSLVYWNDISETMVLGPEIIEDMMKQIVGKVAYKLDLPNELERVHNVFHVSQIRKYVPDVAHVLQPETNEMDENLTYEERLDKILDAKVRSTRNKDVKVLWSNHKTEEATWEVGADMRKRYPELFT